MLSAGSVLAQQWQHVTASEDGASWSIDAESIRTEGGYVLFRAIEQLSTPATHAGLKAAVVSLVKDYAGDCSRRTFTITGYDARDASGNTVDSYTSPRTRWKHNLITPGSVAFSLLEFACEAAGRGFGARDEDGMKFLSSDLWELVEIATGSKSYLDAGAVTATDDGLMTLVKTEFDEPQSAADVPYSTSVSSMVYSCQDQTTRLVFLWLYDVEGRLVREESVSASAVRARAGSREAAFLGAVCSKWAQE